MASVIIDVPAELPSALGVLPADVGREIQLMAALKLFECGRISGGMAAELAGMPRADFLVRRFSRPPIFSSADFLVLCGRHGVPAGKARRGGRTIRSHGEHGHASETIYHPLPLLYFPHHGKTRDAIRPARERHLRSVGVGIPICRSQR
jgi:hypothetical protein